MNTSFPQLKELVGGISPNTRRRAVWTLIVLFILQLYFVRELIAAELLFGAVFAAMFLLAGICYVIGAVGERGLDMVEIGVRAIAPVALRTYGALEDLIKKPFRHPRSESAR